MFWLIVICIVAVAPITIAGFVDICFDSIPKEYHKVPGKIIWLIVTSFVLELVGMILIEKLPLAAVSVEMLGFLIYFTVRAVAFVGLAASFRAYAADNPVSVSALGGLMAWIASTVDALGMVGVVFLVIEKMMSVSHVKIDDLEHASTLMLVCLSGGIFLAVPFLLIMNSNKNKIQDLARIERKKKTDELMQERKKTKPGATLGAGKKSDRS